MADDKGSALWKAFGVLLQGVVLSALTGRASEAVQTITTGIGALRATGSTLWMPFWLSCLAKSLAHVGQIDEARFCINDAMTTINTSKEKLFEPEVNRVAGEIALLSGEPDIREAEAHFARSLTIASGQEAKSWELRAATRLACLWQERGESNRARGLLAPIYGWFTEGLLTRDLQEFKNFAWRPRLAAISLST